MAGQNGRVVAGCRLQRLIGRGERSEVWLASDRSDGSRVAVKLYGDGSLPVGERLRVRHPRVVGVRRLQDDPPAAVLQLAEGGSLASLVGARGPLEAGEAVAVVAPLAEALGDLHRAGLVHGDVTPANVLLTGDGDPLLGDLTDLRVAGVGPVVATAGFAAPEVLAGGAPGGAADVHGLSATAWFALSGAAPGHASDRVPLPLLVPGLPVELARAVTAGLDPDPSRRPAPDDLAETLVATRAPEPVRLVAAAGPAPSPAEAVTHRLRAGPGDPAPASPTPARPRHGRPRSGPGRLRRWRPLVASAAVGAAGGVGLGALGALDGLVPGDPASTGTRPLGTSLGTSLGTRDAPPHPPSLEPAPGVLSAASASSGPPGAADPVALLAGLVSDREAALRSGDVEALAAVYAEGAAAASADVTLVERSGPLDVSLAVHETAVRSQDPASVVLDATILTSPSGAGGPTAVETSTGVVRVELVHDGVGWRIGDVREGPDAPGDRATEVPTISPTTP